MRTGKPLSVELGPGIMGSIFDGKWFNIYLCFMCMSSFSMRILIGIQVPVTTHKTFVKSVNVCFTKLLHET